ncbi:hypothetical protein [Haliea sp. E17]|uniref:hypothetical protein n=1 Tax=Haliea sp. E17 TaxID=3401576 RepID=UPI003AB0F6D1
MKMISRPAIISRPDRGTPRSRPAACSRIAAPAFVLATLFALSACKIVIHTPEYGYVDSVSGDYLCEAGNECTIDVSDTNFSEIFIAHSIDDERQFSHWRHKYPGETDIYLCGARNPQCLLATTRFDQFALLLAFLDSDKEFVIEPVFVRDISRGGDAVSECLIPRFPKNADDFSAWNNNCDFPALVSWVDEGECASRCSVTVQALKQSTHVTRLTGEVVWAVCPADDGLPRTTGGGAWKGQREYTCTSAEGIEFNAEDREDQPPAPTATLSEIQSRVFNVSCAFSGCHGSGAGGLNLKAGQSFANLVNIPSSQNSSFIRVIPGDADNSLLVRKIEGTQPFGLRMPLGGGPLSSANIQLIRDWIDAGALDN